MKSMNVLIIYIYTCVSSENPGNELSSMAIDVKRLLFVSELQLYIIKVVSRLSLFVELYSHQ